MTNRLALIVDDSRSARHILARMLESFGLEVAAVESAELALTYLQGARPDVIFMDHLMPGMDGFAAVRVLKANPDTVTIPVLMYTSQEGEMYMSQARALGAMGVLPKTLKHADVAAALQHLSLLPADKLSTTVTAAPRVVASAAAAALEAPLTSATQPPALQPEAAQLSATTQTMPQIAHRIALEVRDELQQVTAQISRRLNFWRALAAFSGVVCMVLLALLLFLQHRLRQQLDQMQETQQQVQALLTQPLPDITTAAASASSMAPLVIESLPVAYGEVPLSGARLEHLRELQTRYGDEPRSLLIRIESAAADFCLNRNDSGAYELAADATLQASCELVGNPFGDALSVQQRQSVGFANLLASINSAAGSNIKVQLQEGGRPATTPYPLRSATLTAGEWNEVAARNQYVTFTVQAAP